MIKFTTLLYFEKYRNTFIRSCPTDLPPRRAEPPKPSLNPSLERRQGAAHGGGDALLRHAYGLTTLLGLSVENREVAALNEPPALGLDGHGGIVLLDGLYRDRVELPRLDGPLYMMC